MFDIFSNDPKKGMTQKELELNASRLRLVTAAGSVLIMVLGVTLASVKLANELKRKFAQSNERDHVDPSTLKPT